MVGFQVQVVRHDPLLILIVHHRRMEHIDIAALEVDPIEVFHNGEKAFFFIIAVDHHVFVDVADQEIAVHQIGAEQILLLHAVVQQVIQKERMEPFYCQQIFRLFPTDLHGKFFRIRHNLFQQRHLYRNHVRLVEHLGDFLLVFRQRQRFMAANCLKFFRQQFPHPLNESGLCRALQIADVLVEDHTHNFFRRTVICQLLNLFLCQVAGFPHDQPCIQRPAPGFPCLDQFHQRLH